jgi:hypothetical protein
LIKQELVYLYESEGENFIQIATWDKHQQIRAKRSKFPAPDITCINLISSDIICNQMISHVSDIICNHLISDAPVIQSNPIQSESNPIRESPKKTKDKNASKKPYGEFKNVLLTDDEYQKLRTKFNGATENKIEAYSAGKESKGLKYLSDYATILNWERMDAQRNGGTNGVNQGYNRTQQRTDNQPVAVTARTRGYSAEELQASLDRSNA